MFQVRRFRVTQPAEALASVNEREGVKAWDGRIRGCVDSMVQYLVIVLIGENASRRFSGATFAGSYFCESYISNHEGWLAIETVRRRL
ncbi:hypothetical protein BI292_14980 [Pseudomonas sp. 43NM1]|nr:hypothetical protein BI292_14980 [Pseudomonas sp. 43NM1]